jgi:hypothetical protein
LFAPVSTTTIRNDNTARSLSLLQKLQQLGDIRRNSPRLIFREQLAADRRSEFVLIIDVCEPLPMVIAHNKIA